MNWHVLAIMQSLLSHRLLFIGSLGKSLKNWPSHLTTTGFFSTWLGVGEEYFSHLYALLALLGSAGRQWLSPTPSGSPSSGTRQPRSQWKHSHVSRSFEVWSIGGEAGTREAEERDLCSRERSQIRAGCESLWLTGSSWARLGHWHKSFSSSLS